MFVRRNPDQPFATPTAADRTFDFADLNDLPDVEAETRETAPQIEAPRYTEAEIAPLFEDEPEALPQPTPFVPTNSPVQAVEREPATAPAPAAPRAAESLIGPEDFFDGNYRSERGVRIQGTARGSIESRQYILVEEGAVVEANIAAESIIIAGTFTGSIECRGRLEVMTGGSIRGNVITANLIIQEGGVLDGQIQMRRSDAS